MSKHFTLRGGIVEVSEFKEALWVTSSEKNLVDKGLFTHVKEY